MSKEDSDGDTGSQVSLRSDSSMDRPINIQCPDRHKEDSDGDTGSQVSLRSDSSMDRPINIQCPDRHNHPDGKTVLPVIRDDYQRKMEEAISKQRKTEKEFKDFKERVSHQLSRSLRAQDTENINKPLNKSRLKEMFDHLRINEWPKVTDQLRASGEDPDSVCKIIQNTFDEAIDDVETVKKSMNKLFQKDLPLKVQEHLQASVESLQMAVFHNKEAKASTAELAPRAWVVSECYRLGCLMALNEPSLQLDWKNTHKQMDVWDFLPRRIIPREESQDTHSALHYDAEQTALTRVKVELQSLFRALDPDWSELQQYQQEQSSSRDRVLEITLDVLRGNGQEALAELLSSKTANSVFTRKLKSDLNKRFSHVFEGVAKAGDSAPLTQIYTELYITEGGASEVNQEHEVRLMEIASRKPAAPETTITCEDMFKPRPHSPQPIRAVLTNGVAGVGKTVLTQKFSLDWAEGRAHQDFQLLFPFSFRELNVLKDRSFSLVGLINHFFSPSKSLCSFEDLQVLLIFDGLDECRLPLAFSSSRVLSDPTESVSLDLLLVNLIRGSLLPSARLWITTRPAAANQIPAECVSMVTEVRGFTDPQKEQYFRRRFIEERQATAIISHIKSVRSLHIMCHIPVFCWILSTVLQTLLKQTEEPELPWTLTQMYTHFLVVQTKVHNIKYQQESGEHHWTPLTREMVKSLGKLAFEQLQRGNLIFYDCDLRECGMDAAAASVYSGVFTQVFIEEPGLYQDKVYCFIHLSVQEFLAALHVHQTFYSSGENLLSPKHSQTIRDFYRSAVDQALQSPNGHLDLFLRFLFGLSLPTNQSPLRGLLTQTTGRLWTNQDAVRDIKTKMNEKVVSVERSLNLLYCLLELNDHDLVEEIQKMIGNGHLHGNMSPAKWSALVFLLLSSNMDIFDLRKYNASEEALQRLMPVVKASNTVILSECRLSSVSCATLASVLSSSSLTLLDMSNNDLEDSGVEQLCEGLKSLCRLETLRLSGCLIKERGGRALASALSSSSTSLSSPRSRLKELDISYNDPGPSTKQLKDLRLSLTLSMNPAGEKWLTPGLRKYFCELSLDPNTAHRRLRLSEDKRTVTYVNEEQPYPDDPVRFTSCPQVLCDKALRGRSYWEVDLDLSSTGSVFIALTYIGIPSEKEFGSNKDSWALEISRGLYTVWHDGKVSTHSYTPQSQQSFLSLRYNPPSITRVAVYLDFAAGTVSWYDVSCDKMALLHLFHTTLSQPVYAGFKVLGSSVSLVPHRSAQT